MQRLISVICPTYNRADLLPQTIESVIAQTYKNWELLIIDDGSTDNTKQVVEKYLSEKISFVESSHSGLPAVARNIGIKKARGEWIAFLDSDDTWLPRKLEVQIQTIEKAKDVDLVCCNAFRGTDEFVKEDLQTFYIFPSKKSDNYFRELIDRNFIITSSVVARKKVMEQGGGFNERPELAAIEDYDLWLRCSIDCNLAYLSEPLIIYRDNVQEGIRGTISRVHYWKEILKIYDHLRNHLLQKGQVVDPILENKIRSTKLEIAKAYLGWNSVPIATARKWYGLLKRFVRGRGLISPIPSRQQNRLKLNSDEIKEYVENNKGNIRLHLGCGEKAFEGYINIDFPPANHSVQISSPANYYHDIRTLHFPPTSIAEIRLHHVFEHFDRPTALRLLINWNTWLIEGGKLIIEVPDFNRCAIRLLSPFKSWQKKASTMRHIFGSHEAEWAYHYEGWNKQRLKYTLERLGFSSIKFVRTRWKKTFNITVLARKEAPLSKKELEIKAMDLLEDSLIDRSDSECSILDIWQKNLIK